MDTITHGLFGFTQYKLINKEDMSKKKRHALLFTTLAGCQAPDIDVVANFTEIGQIMQQMWHRGLTHSIFLVPLWALLIYGLVRFIFKEKDPLFFWMGLIAVFIHDTIDLFNAWGTGYFEPFSAMRVTIGTIPIVDLVFWSLFIIGLIVAWRKKQIPDYVVYRVVAALMLAHFAIQTTQGLIVEQQAAAKYEQTELSASFVPWKFTVIGKNDNQIEIYEDSLFTKPKLTQTLHSKETADLKPLFAKNPEAHVLYQWSPFVVIVDDAKRLGIYDPRFFRNGESFLAQYMNK